MSLITLEIEQVKKDNRQCKDDPALVKCDAASTWKMPMGSFLRLEERQLVGSDFEWNI